MQCNLETFMYFRHPKGHFVPFQKHQYHEIVFYKSGRGRTTINGEIYDYVPGSLAIIPRGVEHDEVTIETTDVYFCLFDCDLSSDFSGTDFIVCASQTVDHIVDTFERLQEEYSQGYTDSHEMLNHIMAQLLVWVSRSCQKKPKSQEETLRYIHTYIKEYCEQKINFDILAESSGYSASRLRHLYTERFGQSMQQYQINSRINKAKLLLVDTDLPVKDVGLNCGFPSPSRFAEIFRERFGITPQKYRSIMKTEHAEHFILEP